ncbi:MAG: hypothetical protein SV377_07335 [Halobacteria archaeon]|nr:hypothetical protein [Halobacteria archaeon]
MAPNTNSEGSSTANALSPSVTLVRGLVARPGSPRIIDGECLLNGGIWDVRINIGEEAG